MKSQNECRQRGGVAQSLSTPKFEGQRDEKESSMMSKKYQKSEVSSKSLKKSFR